jgi:hypothetical protein
MAGGLRGESGGVAYRGWGLGRDAADCNWRGRAASSVKEWRSGKWLVRGAIAGGLGSNPSGLTGGYGGGRRSDVASISHSGLRSPALPKAARRHRASDLARQAPGASPAACPVHGSPISILQQANQVSFVFNFQFPMSICIL